ncbi:hypothetical protein Poli38472_012377 [Pythium oligandrum]|uniref:Uncharacterized protein n=1 Tax=Pythium oligandrum TaxID=41045 RepID=A0A8K1FLL1_PYTOL|nr:hypothetical protein Poli38472_012377 [Pythium oligandrum]|eukprot:TMW67261.1 hypothetical protein Poli38472_012377 [Pythium oligandrum]
MELLPKDDTTSDSGASTTASPAPVPQDVDASLETDVGGRKKRKPTYYVRKDEAAALRAEIEVLQKKLDEIMRKGMEAENEAFVESIAKGVELQLSLGQTTNTIAGVQGVLSAHQAAGGPFPLETFIHLTKDVEQRRHALLSVRELKLNSGLDYMVDRTRALDLCSPHKKYESSYSPEGNFSFSLFDVNVFSGVPDVKHVYDTLMDYIQYQEISVTDILGMISIRESDNCDDQPVLQCRMVTTLSNGLEVENNAAMFLNYFDHSDALGSPYGIVITETIDRDDMFPYKSETRARLRITSIVLVSKTPNESTEPGKMDVTMTRAIFGCIYLPSDAVGTSDAESVAAEFAAQLSGVMTQVLRERLGPQKL